MVVWGGVVVWGGGGVVVWGGGGVVVWVGEGWWWWWKINFSSTDKANEAYWRQMEGRMGRRQ